MAKKHVYHHRFRLKTRDGEEIDWIELRDFLKAWAKEQGIVPFRCHGQESQSGYAFGYRGRFVKVEIKDKTHALWFKMRWATDIAAFERSEAEREEREALMNKITCDIRRSEDERILKQLRLVASSTNGRPLGSQFSSTAAAADFYAQQTYLSYVRVPTPPVPLPHDAALAEHLAAPVETPSFRNDPFAITIDSLEDMLRYFGQPF